MYPFYLLQNNVSIHPLLHTSFGTPYFFDYTNPIFAELPIRDTVYMQKWNVEVLAKNNTKWGIAGYLEDRSHRLRGTRLIDEGRVYHLGIDIIAPANTAIYNPLDGTVIESSIETGKAGYGGYTIVRYTGNWSNSFLVLYGHLDPAALCPPGDIKAGEVLGSIGSSDVNGDWTTHLHMQTFTGKDFDIWKMKGYCSLADIPTIKNYCPDPSFLIRY